MKSIRILDKDMNRLGEIDKYEDFKINRRFYNLSEFEFKVKSNNVHIDKLEQNNLIILHKYYDRVGIILHKEFEGDKSKGNMLIKGVTLQGLISRREIVPDIDQDFEQCIGKQETIIKHFVNKNCINPIDSNRKIENLIIENDKLRGEDDAWISSYDNLSDKLKEICEYCGLGWNVTLDIKEKKFIFDVIEGKNLTVNQRENPPVTFRNDFGNVLTRSYLESIINHKNVIYVGTKEDKNKLVLSVGNVSGFERIEVFESVNSDDPTELIKEGKVKLNELDILKTFEIEVNPNDTFKYEVDYNLGDIVTVQDRKLGLTMDVRIVEIEEIHNKGKISMKITFGSSIPNILTKIKKIERRVK